MKLGWPQVPQTPHTHPPLDRTLSVSPQGATRPSWQLLAGSQVWPRTGSGPRWHLSASLPPTCVYSSATAMGDRGRGRECRHGRRRLEDAAATAAAISAGPSCPKFSSFSPTLQGSARRDVPIGQYCPGSSLPLAGEGPLRLPQQAWAHLANSCWEPAGAWSWGSLSRNQRGPILQT